MKTISLEIDEGIYPQVVDFLRLLPKDRCQGLEEDDSTLSAEEYSVVRAAQARIQAGDEGDFVDWEAMRAKL